jgi:radical SAM superfamily enzyme YgiQ (UPF0313 family)
MEEHENDKVALALPSIRVDAFSVDLIKEIQKVKKTGLTFAPEAGSQRMRDVINKGLTEERILEASKSAFESGWNTLKLYFMVKNAPQRYKDFLYLVPIPFIFYETLRFSGIAYIPLLGIVTRLRSTSFFAALYIVGTVQPIIIERNA